MIDVPTTSKTTRDGPLSFAASRRHVIVAGLLVVLAVGPLVANALGQPFYVEMLMRTMVYGIAAMSLDLLVGYAGIISLGHAAFLGIGAYVIGILDYNLQNDVVWTLGPFHLSGSTNAFVVWPIAVGISALAALIIGAICLRTRGVSLIMITLAFAQMFYYIALSLDQYGGQDGLRLSARSTLGPIPTNNDLVFYYLVLIVLVAVFVLLSRLINSRFGMVIRGCLQNENRMRSLGYETYRYKLACFVIAGTIAGLAGVLLANMNTFVSPDDTSFARSGDLLIMGIIGGFGSIVGPVIGAGVYLGAQVALGSLTTHWQVIFGPILILLVLFVRGGIVAKLSGARRRGW
jgi:branched-chain amino acid transport system permease protein